VRATTVGRILYRWEADTLTDSPWRCTGEIIRCDRQAGECLNDRTSEQIQSPFFVQQNGLYYMFYGGVNVGVPDGKGNYIDVVDLKVEHPLLATHRPSQICLMTSPDGRTWTRHQNSDGYSRVFAGPGAARDPCLIKIGDLWYLYYVGYEGSLQENHGFCVRTSKDLIHWSDWTLVHQDHAFGMVHWQCECPFVVERDGYFYLFRTKSYYDAETYVFRSEDPLDFGVGDASDKLVGTLAVGAPELYKVSGQEYISSNHEPQLGTQMCRLQWVEE
jgi:sucrose-6-phosphate hydrolase SacC (GH32 family)